MSKTYIHYGGSEFSKEIFNPVKNSNFIFTKPAGGLWASDVNAEFGWIDWCRAEGYRVSRLVESFAFNISDDAKVLLIDSISKLESLPTIGRENPFGSVFGIRNTEYIDFEKLAEEYDAMEVLITSDPDLYYALYGWDCDSILIMNPAIVKPFY